MSFRVNKPAGLEKSEDYRVTATVPGREEELYCTHAVVGNRFKDYSMAYEKMTFCSVDWDFSAPLTIKVTPERPWKEVCIRPVQAGVPYEICDGSIIIRLDKPQKFSLELDGDLYRNLFVYATLPAEVPTGENVRVFGPGVHEVGEISVGTGETIYIDGDAVVYGWIRATGENIRLCGHGVISAEKENHDVNKHRVQLFHGEQCCGLRMDGIIMLDSPGWTLCLVRCQDMEITDLKQICYNPNSDGFDICSCQNVHIADCFVRNFDDNISIKSFGGDNRHILMENCILWADCAHNMLVGPESRKENEDHFCHIAFRNIDVLEHKEYSEFFMGVMAIFCADLASFYDIEWDGIRIERMTNGRIFDCNYVDAYAQTYGKCVKDVRMKNIDCAAPVLYKSRIRGMDAGHTMEGFVLENFRIHGIPVCAGEPSFEIGDFVEDLVIR
ncbi:MAG: hypothetical protein IKV57_03195 [Clostridia bacterium]|nr:hypothetical protein [Clostridia bacterium]